MTGTGSRGRAAMGHEAQHCLTKCGGHSVGRRRCVRRQGILNDRAYDITARGLEVCASTRVPIVSPGFTYQLDGDAVCEWRGGPRGAERGLGAGFGRLCRPVLQGRGRGAVQRREKGASKRRRGRVGTCLAATKTLGSGSCFLLVKRGRTEASWRAAVRGVPVGPRQVHHPHL